jgi:hypothetical protein
MSTIVERGAVAGAARTRTRSRSRSAATSLAALTAASFSLSAGLVHLAYTRTHWLIWLPYGLFFLGTGVAQMLLAGVLAVRRPPAWLTLGGIAMNLGIIGMYVVSRTAYGAPIGPMRGHAELPTPVDMATTAGEFVTVVALLMLLPQRIARHTTTLLLLAGAGLWYLRVSGKLATSG